jgi:glycosyltransferase involved in cell wall biosynthesis
MTNSRKANHRVDDRITVLFVQTQSWFGADSQIHASIAEHLDQSRFRVIVACNDGASQGSPALREFQRLDHVEVRPTDFGPSRADSRGLRLLVEMARRLPFVWGLVRLARFARKNGVDIVHGTEKPRDVLYGYLIGRACGAKTLTQLHVKMESWISPLTRKVMHHDDALVGVSEFVSQSAIAMGYDADRVYTVLNALEVDKWQPDDFDAVATRRDLGVPDEITLIAIIARGIPWKGHAELIRALALVRDRSLPFHLAIVGDDDPRATVDGVGYMDSLRQLVDRLGLADHVTFTGYRSDVPALMTAIDVFAMPSYEEPFGMVYLEAMAMRKPIVGSRSGGVVEFIEDGVTGFLSEPGDEETLADNLEKLISEPELRRRMGEAGRATVLASFASPRMADDMERVYQSVLGRPLVAPP